MKRLLIISLAISTVGLGLFLAFRSDDLPQNTSKNSADLKTTQSQKTNEQPVGGTTELVIGNADAAITIVEYGDYKCPKCNDFHQKAGKDIRREWVDTGKAKIIYRPYPLFGEDSGLALYASFCAAEQGKFAAYHDKMFAYMWGNYFSKGDLDATTAKLFTPEKLGELAHGAGLSGTEFTTCAGGQSHADAYNTAVDKAAGDEVQGTPTLIIGGQKIIGSQPYNIYKALLQIQ
ncbi:thioredoxin domain-containing protein [Candidatus Saccharibacteria bacterium]|nr:MAG: thioredoxin domain-containing protein [Candidatus Saccharibacteria bacterium]